MPGEIFCSWNNTWWDCSSLRRRPAVAPGWYRCYRRPSTPVRARKGTTYWSRAKAPSTRRTRGLSRKASWLPATSVASAFNATSTVICLGRRVFLTVFERQTWHCLGVYAVTTIIGSHDQHPVCTVCGIKSYYVQIYGKYYGPHAPYL